MTQVSAVPSEEVTSSAATFDSEVAQMMGDYTANEAETPEPETTSAAGTTPAEPEPGTETKDAPAGDGEEAALSDGTTPETPAAPTSDEADPFAETTPATFTVNGVTVTNEDIRVFKEGGAVIRPEGLPNILNRLSERESLFERNRLQSQEYQTLSKVTEWTTPEGKQYTGPEAAIEMRIGNAALLAENKLLVDHLTDPDKLYSLLTTEQVPDGQGGMRERIILNPTALSGLQRENSLTVRELTATIRDHFKNVVAEASKPVTTINYETESPRLVAEIAKSENLDSSLLTADDKRLLADLLPDHTKNGQASVKWQNLAKSLMRDRATQKATTQTVVSTTEKATREGQARMAAAARGLKPASRPVTPIKPITPEKQREDNEGDAWDIMERAASSAMRQRA